MSDSDLTAPAFYFPINEQPFKMTAGLHRLGHDFENGSADQLYFQQDRHAEEYRDEKARVLATHPSRLGVLKTSSTDVVLRHVLQWMRARLRVEHGLSLNWPSSDALRDQWLALSLSIQEDFAIVHQDESGSDSLVLLSVCFPSGWRPEKLLGAGFHETHAPVPEFAQLQAQRAQLVHAMIHRGPYVRFVWSVTPDSRLDHHPIDAPQGEWKVDSKGFLRVERQTTVPFPEQGASLFLIRTYLYPIQSLSLAQRRTLFVATSGLPRTIQSYKGITPATLQALEAATKP